MIYRDKGYIGCFEMADKESGVRQLTAHVEELKAAGHKRIVAPINGDTWHSYRFVSWTSDEPAFPLEPQNPIWYNEVFQACGFRPLKRYRSDQFPLARVEALPQKDPAICLRAFRDGDLEVIYHLSTQGFDGNFLYDDIPFDTFFRLYQPFLPMLDGALTAIAEVEGRPTGFIFSYAAGDRLILKSMAVLPAFRSRGIGAMLINHVLLAGRRMGLETAVAALMSEDNHSQAIVSKYGSERIREYTLYCLETEE